MKQIILNLLGHARLLPKAYSKTFHVKQLDAPTADDIVCTIIGGALLALLYCAFTFPG